MSPTMPSTFNGISFASAMTAVNTPSNVTYSEGELMVASYRTRAEQLKVYDDAKNALLQEVIHAYHYNVSTQGHVIREREEERRVHAAIMRQKEVMEDNVQMLQGLLNQNPFVICLLDGNEFCFSDVLLGRGAEGGKHAAIVLKDILLGWSRANVVGLPKDTTLIVRVFVNLKGLVRSLSASRQTLSTEKVADFFQGFMSDNTMFDFVDVGDSKGRALQKITDQFKLNSMDLHCRQTIVGCTPTGALSDALQEAVERHPKVLERASLVEGPLLSNKLLALQYLLVQLGGILQYHKPLSMKPSGQPGFPRVDTTISSAGLNGASHPFTPRTITPYTPASITATPAPLELSEYPRIRSDSTTSSFLSHRDVGISRNESPGVWAQIAKSSAPLPLTDLTQRDLPSRAGPVTTTIRRNRRGQRVDELIPYDREEVQALKRVKWCNQHYIGAGCCHFNAGKPEKCPHKHEGQLTARQKNVLRVIARETPCKRGTTCDDVNCIYGHRCPFPAATEGTMRGLGCLNGENCRFPHEMHGMDTVPVNTIRATGAF